MAEVPRTCWWPRRGSESQCAPAEPVAKLDFAGAEIFPLSPAVLLHAEQNVFECETLEGLKSFVFALN